MKYLLIITIGVLFLKTTIAQNIESTSFIANVIGKSFCNKDTILILLENRTEKKIFIQISLQKKNKKGWQDVLLDIYKINTEVSLENILYLNKQEKRSEYWLPILSQINGKTIKGEYRFRLSFGQRPDKKINRINTTSFVLN